MTLEKDYIIKTFNQNFNIYKDKKIFLYGIGLNTKTIVDNFDEYNILGLLDGQKSDEYIYGKYIFKLKDILDKKPDMIIVIARRSSRKIIYRRIGEFCKENSIMLYDIDGNNLLMEYDKKCFDEPYFKLNSTELKKAINNYDIISFDIFDTLIMRKCLLPTDVFDIVSFKTELPFNFKDERVKAERMLLEKNINPTLEEIYKQLSLNNNNYDTYEIMNYELNIEKKLLVKRNEMVEILKYAIELGKKVYLISDMYLTQEVLKEILDGVGICGYSEIFVSCEYGVSKSNGLFKIFKNTIKGNSYLHIGDNEEADGYFAQNCGIDTFLIKSAYDLAELSTLNKIFDYAKEFNSRLHIGIFICEIFNNPFVLYNSEGRIKIDSSKILGKFVAPITTDFVLWLIKMIQSDECYNVLLASRDGYLICKLLNCIKLENCTRIEYFLTSRIVSILSSITCDKDIDNIIKLPYTGTNEQMLRKRFLLSDSEIREFNKENYASLKDYVYAHKDFIMEKAKMYRNNYEKYISKFKFDFEKKTGFFDFVSSGTSQLSLNKILEKDLNGYYFVRIIDDNQDKRNLNIKSMQKQGYSYELKSNLYDKYIFLENIFTSDKPTLIGFDDNGNPQYKEEDRTEEEIREVIEIQESIVNYFKEYISLIEINNFDTLTNVSDVILGQVNGKLVDFSSEILSNLVLRDDFNGTVFESNAMLD